MCRLVTVSYRGDPKRLVVARNTFLSGGLSPLDRTPEETHVSLSKVLDISSGKYRSYRVISEESLPSLDLTDKHFPSSFVRQFFLTFDIRIISANYRAAFKSVLRTAGRERHTTGSELNDVDLSQECKGFCLIFNDDFFCLQNVPGGFKLYHRLDSIIQDTFEECEELYGEFYLGR